MTSTTTRLRVTLARINEWIAVQAVKIMSSMTCVWLFVLWALLPSVHHQWEQMVFYVSGGFIQLVALPLIMVGQNVMSRNMARKAQEDSDKLDQILRLLEEKK